MVTMKKIYVKLVIEIVLNAMDLHIPNALNAILDFTI